MSASIKQLAAQLHAGVLTGRQVDFAERVLPMIEHVAKNDPRLGNLRHLREEPLREVLHEAATRLTDPFYIPRHTLAYRRLLKNSAGLRERHQRIKKIEAQTEQLPELREETKQCIELGLFCAVPYGSAEEVELVHLALDAARKSVVRDTSYVSPPVTQSSRDPETEAQLTRFTETGQTLANEPTAVLARQAAEAAEEAREQAHAQLVATNKEIAEKEIAAWVATLTPREQQTVKLLRMGMAVIEVYRYIRPSSGRSKIGRDRIGALQRTLQEIEKKWAVAPLPDAPEIGPNADVLVELADQRPDTPEGAAGAIDLKEPGTSLTSSAAEFYDAGTGSDDADSANDSGSGGWHSRRESGRGVVQGPPRVPVSAEQLAAQARANAPRVYSREEVEELQFVETGKRLIAAMELREAAAKRPGPAPRDPNDPRLAPGAKSVGVGKGKKERTTKQGRDTTGSRQHEKIMLRAEGDARAARLMAKLAQQQARDAAATARERERYYRLVKVATRMDMTVSELERHLAHMKRDGIGEEFILGEFVEAITQGVSQ